MSEQTDLTGRIVTSKAGRDKGRSFLVVAQLDADHVAIVDGTLRKLNRPKKKKLKHLTLETPVAEGLREKIINGKQVFDAEIRKNLIALGFNNGLET